MNISAPSAAERDRWMREIQHLTSLLLAEDKTHFKEVGHGGGGEVRFIDSSLRRNKQKAGLAGRDQSTVKTQNESRDDAIAGERKSETLSDNLGSRNTVVSNTRTAAATAELADGWVEVYAVSTALLYHYCFTIT